MDPSEQTQKIKNVPGTDSVGILRDIGRSLRRVKGKDTFGKDGLRVIWHQGKLRTDLSSWENDKQEIHRQEFSFFGHMVEFRLGHGLRTGTLPSGNGEGPQSLTPKSELFKPQRDLDIGILDAGSTILRAIGKRDYFTQHMLKELNAALNEMSKAVKRTQVLGLDIFHALEKIRAEESHRPVVAKANNATYLAAAIVASAVIIAGLLYFFLARG